MKGSAGEPTAEHTTSGRSHRLPYRHAGVLLTFMCLSPTLDQSTDSVHDLAMTSGHRLLYISSPYSNEQL